MSRNNWHTTSLPTDTALVVQMKDGQIWFGWIDKEDNVLYLDDGRSIKAESVPERVERWRYPTKSEQYGNT